MSESGLGNRNICEKKQTGPLSLINVERILKFLGGEE